MEKINVVVKNLSEFPLPEYKTLGSSGMDIKVDLLRTFGSNGKDTIQPLMNHNSEYKKNTYILRPQEVRVFQTGIFVEIPEGFEIQVRSRSGLSVQGIMVVNAPGTIDSDYRGEIGIILGNISHTDFNINHGDRIAQLVLAKVEKVQWILSDILGETDRGAGGYGSTGKE